jgi:hypothetical protein
MIPDQCWVRAHIKQIEKPECLPWLINVQCLQLHVPEASESTLPNREEGLIGGGNGMGATAAVVGRAALPGG